MAPAVAFANRGYHVLVEKPMAVSEDDCRWVDGTMGSCLPQLLVIDMVRRITKACEDAGVMLVVCHVLRYKQFVVKL